MCVSWVYRRQDYYSLASATLSRDTGKNRGVTYETEIQRHVNGVYVQVQVQLWFGYRFRKRRKDRLEDSVGGKPERDSEGVSGKIFATPAL